MKKKELVSYHSSIVMKEKDMLLISEVVKNAHRIQGHKMKRLNAMEMNAYSKPLFMMWMVNVRNAQMDIYKMKT